MTALAVISLLLALLPLALFAKNFRLFQPPPTGQHDGNSAPSVSVLIPARNEEKSIGAAVKSVLASNDVELEIIVLDDQSEDKTAEIVQDLARIDPRVKLISADSLPQGWCGKQFACHTLAGHAKYPILTFLDADVRLSPDAMSRMVLFMQQSSAGLVSGFPCQETGSWLEKLIIPLINWLLVCYLPMSAMRANRDPRFGAGCGQWFMTSQEAYAKVGGHAAVKSSLHDGVTLPRAYRQAGIGTDICDATELARCRMYQNARGVWNGLAKNAGEGLGSWPGIIVWSVLLLAGHLLPYAVLFVLPFAYEPDDLPLTVMVLSIAAVAASWLPRWLCSWRYRASWVGAFFHPVGVLGLVLIQWHSLFRRVVGKPVGWKGRSHPSLS